MTPEAHNEVGALERLRAMLGAATPGPWVVMRHEMPYQVPFEIAVHHDFGDTICCWDQRNFQYEYPPQVERIEADATLIAAAPTYLAALLDVAEAAQRYAHTTGTPNAAVLAWADVDAALAALKELETNR